MGVSVAATAETVDERGDVLLARLDRVRAELDRARTLADVGAILEDVGRLRRYAAVAKWARDEQNRIARVWFLAQRRAGQLLAPGPDAIERQRSGQYLQKSRNGTFVQPPTIAELGLTKRQSSDWQLYARISERQFLAMLDEIADAWRLTASRLNAAIDLASGTARPRPSKADPDDDAPASRQHFDVWSFKFADAWGGMPGFFGRMAPQVVENLFWLWTEPDDQVVDPFAGSGTTLDIGCRMGRRVWASDLRPVRKDVPIAAHDITTGWPSGAPERADLIFLDPPYWKQAAGRYSDDPADLGNQSLDGFMASWRAVLDACVPHLAPGGRLAFIVSPTQDGDRVVDHAFEMYRACLDAGLVAERRVIVTYQTQQATGQHVLWAREHRKLLKLYRDLVVMGRR